MTRIDSTFTNLKKHAFIRYMGNIDKEMEDDPNIEKVVVVDR